MMSDKTAIGYELFRPLGTFLMFILYRPRHIGKENIPDSGPLILCGNHKDYFDPLMVGMGTKRPLHYLSKIECHRGAFRWFFKFVGTIPVDRSKKDPNAVNKSIEALEKGYAIAIFPEGTRNKTKDLLMPFKYGAVSMASKADATIVPFAITGHYKIFNNDLTIQYGKPFKVGDMTYEEANQKLYNEVEKLIINRKDKKKNDDLIQR